MRETAADIIAVYRLPARDVFFFFHYLLAAGLIHGFFILFDAAARQINDGNEPRFLHLLHLGIRVLSNFTANKGIKSTFICAIKAEN